MRINLLTPFAEKDAVKALGARWDATRKLWYITDVVDLTPFARWIPDLAAATQDPSAGAALPLSSSAKLPAAKPQGVRAKPLVEVPHCGCDVLPWDDCAHTLAP
jgi:hypothetical protein